MTDTVTDSEVVTIEEVGIRVSIRQRLSEIKPQPADTFFEAVDQVINTMDCSYNDEITDRAWESMKQLIDKIAASIKPIEPVVYYRNGVPLQKVVRVKKK